MDDKNRLTCTNSSRTVVPEVETKDVDPTAKKLLRKWTLLQVEKIRIDHQVSAIDTALRLAGVKPESLSKWDESRYVENKPFAGMSLSTACLQVLKDFKEQWLTKSQVEYMLMRGGYTSTAKEPKNSIDITLRRLAEDGKCQAIRSRGARGNKYCWLPKKERRRKNELKVQTVGTEVEG